MTPMLDQALAGGVMLFAGMAAASTSASGRSASAAAGAGVTVCVGAWSDGPVRRRCRRPGDCVPPHLS